MASDRAYFLLRKAHSLSGVLPVGVFLIYHLWTNSYAVYGREAFTHEVSEIQRIPYLPYVEWIGIFLPLAFHALLGVWMVLQGRSNSVRYPYARNWMYLLQRVTGIIAFVFIAVHLWQYRVQKSLGAMAASEFYDQLGLQLERTLPFAFYLVGVSSAVFHLANGLWGFCVSWGITATRGAQRKAAFVLGLGGIALWVLAIDILAHFYTGGSVVPGVAEAASP